MTNMILKLVFLLFPLISFATQAGDIVMKDYLYTGLSKNKNISNLKVDVINKEALQNQEGWYAYTMLTSGNENRGENSVSFSRRSLYFTNGTLVTPDLRNAKTDERYKITMAPTFKHSYYSDEYYLFGNKNAKHKVAIFSDPLCPYCIKYVPEVIKKLQKKPAEYCVYYYHLPLPMHPAADTLVKAAMYLEFYEKERFDIRKLYQVKIPPHEKDITKILKAFNKIFKSQVSPEDILHNNIENHYEQSVKISETLMVNGTPTLFLDGKVDNIGRFIDP